LARGIDIVITVNVVGFVHSQPLQIEYLGKIFGGVGQRGECHDDAIVVRGGAGGFDQRDTRGKTHYGHGGRDVEGEGEKGL
jgi:hypothetical protein